MNAADVLDDAADLIEQRGWWNGEGKPEGCYCPITAIVAVTRPFYHPDPAQRALRAYVGCGGIAYWNDRQSDGAPVLAAMRACAADLRGTA